MQIFVEPPSGAEGSAPGEEADPSIHESQLRAISDGGGSLVDGGGGWLLAPEASCRVAGVYERVEGTVGVEWLGRRTGVTPAAGQNRFLGQFTAGSTTLILTNLPPHESLKLAYDLYVIASWMATSRAGRGRAGRTCFGSRFKVGRSSCGLVFRCTS